MDHSIFQEVKDEYGNEHVVTYIVSNHLSVICQMYGSVWPRVQKFCFFNAILSAVLWYADMKYDNIDLSIDPSGHRYLAALVSFLVIARLKIIYGYSIRAREQLNVMTYSALELVELATTLTSDNRQLEALEWRKNIALGIIELIRDCVDALSYNSELASELTEDQIIRRRTCFRQPTLTALKLKKSIVSHRTEFGFEMSTMIQRPVEELKLLSLVDNFIDAFFKIDSLINTPFPFPLVQMARVILYFWVFTLPLALIHSRYPLWGICMLIFLLTYGFIGIEFVCIEMSDPFGDDANDFDQVNLARIAFEDIYLVLYRNDGHEGEVSKVRRIAEDMLSKSRFFNDI